MAKKVTKIEPVRQSVIQALRPKKRVCAYCRVSTDSTRQHTSYVAQVEYYVLLSIKNVQKRRRNLSSLKIM